MYRSHEVQDRILTVNSWKLSSWRGSSTPGTEIHSRLCALMSTQGMYSTRWMLLPPVGKSEELPQCLKSQWLIPGDSVRPSKPFKHLKNHFPDY